MPQIVAGLGDGDPFLMCSDPLVEPLVACGEQSYGGQAVDLSVVCAAVTVDVEGLAHAPDRFLGAVGLAEGPREHTQRRRLATSVTVRTPVPESLFQWRHCL